MLLLVLLQILVEVVDWPGDEAVASNFVVLALAIVLKVQRVISWLRER